jgi:predicted amidophosphoribosyltransferase
MWRFVFFAILGYIIYKVIKTVFKFKKIIGQKLEICPACQNAIQVDNQLMICPTCGEKLGRNQEGKLLIRVN